MDNPTMWDKLMWRLQAAAKNRDNNGSYDGYTLICVNLFARNGQPVCWYRPQRIPLEPKVLNIQSLGMVERKGGWPSIIRDLEILSRGIDLYAIDATLIVKDGLPIGWLGPRKAEKVTLETADAVRLATNLT